MCGRARERGLESGRAGRVPGSIGFARAARQVYARQKVVNAWKKSKNTVYLIYPE